MGNVPRKVTEKQLSILATILNTTVLVTGVTKEDIISNQRYMDKVIARHIVHMFSLKFTTCTASYIAKYTNSKAHATPLHSSKVLRNIIDVKSPLKYYTWILRVEELLLTKLDSAINIKTRLLYLIQEVKEEDSIFIVYTTVIKKMLDDLELLREAGITLNPKLKTDESI